MEKREWDDAFAPVRPDAGLRYKVLKLTQEKKEASSARRLATRLAAVAAVIAIVLTLSLWPSKDGLVTVPGVLKIYAYENTDAEAKGGLVTNLFVDAMKYEPHTWRYVLNCSFGIPVSLEIAEEYYGDSEITFDVKTDIGEFIWYKTDGPGFDQMGNETVMRNGQRIAWKCTYFDREAVRANGGVYIEAIIRADGVAVGYAVLEIGECDDWYFPVRAESVCFPLVDGEFQEVSEEYILQCIAKLKEQCSGEYTYEEKQAEYIAYLESIFGSENTD